MELTLKATPVFEKIIDANTRFILSVGSSRSSKTYSTFQYILVYCSQHKNQGKWISFIRKSFPSLRKTLLREFVKFLTDYGLYNPTKHNKTEQIIELFGNYIEFFSLDNEAKVRGAKRDVAYLNEVNEIDYESANQIFMRTTEKLILDMNPSDSNHWAWEYKNNPNSTYIHSTYKDNTFLEKSLVDQIESYRELDENWWRIYGEGLPGINEATIYTKWREYKNLPQGIIDTTYGLDIGYNHASSLIKCSTTEDANYFEEIIYERHLTTEDLVNRIKDLNINQMIYVDSARPDLIQSLRREGIAANPADKKVKEGIDYIKSKKLFIQEESVNLIKEIRNYKWKTAGEIILDEPVKINDDAVDALRYSAFSNRNKEIDIDNIFFKL